MASVAYINNLNDFAVGCTAWTGFGTSVTSRCSCRPIALLPYYSHPTKGPWVWTLFASVLILIMIICQNYYQSYLGVTVVLRQVVPGASLYLYGGIGAVRSGSVWCWQGREYA